MTSSNSTIDRLCWAPSNSIIARASWSWAACTSRCAVSAGAWARTGPERRTRRSRAPALSIVIAGTLGRTLMLPEPQHLLGAVVVHEHGAVGAERDRAGLAHLGNG